jgi:hypothetical protein
LNKKGKTFITKDSAVNCEHSYYENNEYGYYKMCNKIILEGYKEMKYVLGMDDYIRNYFYVTNHCKT